MNNKHVTVTQADRQRKAFPCPLCGANPHHGLTKVQHCALHGEPFQRFRIKCPKGHVVVEGVNEEMALKEWNTRIEATANVEPFQGRVGGWVLECFTPEIAADLVERCDRALEERLELVQAVLASVGEDFASRGHALVDYVAGRPVGEPSQEVGGDMVTLAALCNAVGIDMMNAAETELARILQPEIIEKIRAKQAAKPVGSALPIAVANVEPVVRSDLFEALAAHLRRINHKHLEIELTSGSEWEVAERTERPTHSIFNQSPSAWLYEDKFGDRRVWLLRQTLPDIKTEIPLYAHPSARITDDKDRGNSVEGVQTTQALLQEARGALEPFAKCAEDWIADDEDDEEWAKFRLLIKDYRLARNILAKLDAALGDRP